MPVDDPILDEDARRFAGDGFGTLTLRASQTEIVRATPQVASRRGVLRFGLPAVYQDSDFAMRFVGALEQVLDPVSATLDSLHAYVDPDLAPRGALQLICTWLGAEVDEVHETSELRRLARHAAELGRLRGTARGLELALTLAFPGLPFRVEGGGSVSWPGSPAADGSEQLVVYCDRPIPENRQAAVARCIEREKPVHATYRLRVKTQKATS